MNDYKLSKGIVDNQIFEEFEKIRRLEEQFNCDKTKIEQWVNSTSLGEFFIGSYTKSMDNDKIINEFAKVLTYYWGMRVKELFPDRNIVVKVGNEIMGELGLAITMYEQL